MGMTTQLGQVSYKGSSDYKIYFGVTDDGRQYFFMDPEDKLKLSNGNRIASTDLKPIIDQSVEHKNVGVINENGDEVIPFTNRSIRPISDSLLLVELDEPIDTSVKEAIEKKANPEFATDLVSTVADIKANISQKMGPGGSLIFHNQFSEATICDINGNNLLDGEYYSFIGSNGGKLYLSKNTKDSEIKEFSMLPPEVQNNAPAASEEQNIDVSEVSVSSDLVENALTGTTENVNEGFSSQDIEIPISLAKEQLVEDTSTNEEETTEVAAAVSSEEAMNSTVAPIAPPVGEADKNSEQEITIPMISEDNVEVEPEGEAVPEETGPDVVEEPSVEEGADVDIPQEPNGGDENEEVSTDQSLVGEPNEESTDVDEPRTEAPAEESVSEEVSEENFDGASLNEEEMNQGTEASEEVVEETVTEEEANKDSRVTISEEPQEEVVEETSEVSAENAGQEEIAEESVGAPAEEEVQEDADDDIVNFSDDDDTDAEVNFEEQVEDTTLDNMFGEVRGNNSNEEYEEEDFFHDSLVQPDTISPDAYTNAGYEEPVYQDSYAMKGTIVSSVAQSMNALMAQNRELKRSVIDLQAKLASAKDANTILNKKFQMLGNKVEALSSKNRNMEAAVARADSKMQLMSDKIQEQGSVIASQNRELQSLRSQLSGFNELGQILEDAQSVLNDDGQYYDQADTYYRRAA